MSLFKSVQGEYHYADAAWVYVKRRTGVDLLGILRDLAAERRGNMASEVRQGDCLEVARGLAAESTDLVYVDPPFFTQKTHALVTRDRSDYVVSDPSIADDLAAIKNVRSGDVILVSRDGEEAGGRHRDGA